MYTNDVCLLVICAFAIAARSTSAIRVYWNTNTGPIVPPEPTTTVRPQPPYREPAPVWEDQHDDIPNPNPYVYVLPPPSRPKPATNNYLTSNIYYNNNRNNKNNNYNNNDSKKSNNNNNNHHRHIILPHEVNAYLQQNPNNVNSNYNGIGRNNNVNNNNLYVASLTPQYIPNVGFKYAAFIPSSESPSPNTSNAKPQGRYNPKTKKYKAYEKSKYVPINYKSTNEGTEQEQQRHQQHNNYQQKQQQEYMHQQKQQQLLPLPQQEPAFYEPSKPAIFVHDKDTNGFYGETKGYTSPWHKQNPNAKQQVLS